MKLRLKQFWCWLRGHGDVDLMFYSNRSASGLCLRCGARVEYLGEP